MSPTRVFRRVGVLVAALAIACAGLVALAPNWVPDAQASANGALISRSLSSYVLLAMDYLAFKGGNESIDYAGGEVPARGYVLGGHVGVNNPDTTGSNDVNMSVGANGWFWMSDGTQLVSGSMRLGDNARVWDVFVDPDVPGGRIGDGWVNDPANPRDGEIVGTEYAIVNNEDLPIFDPASISTAAVCGSFAAVGTQNITVTDGSGGSPDIDPYTLAPGAYGDVRVQNGSVLILTGGSYTFRTFRTGQHASVYTAPGTVIHIWGDGDGGNPDFGLGDGTYFGSRDTDPSPDSEAPAPGVPAVESVACICVSDAINNPAGTANNNTVNFGQDGIFYGSIHAPSAPLNLGNNWTHFGRFVVKTVASDWNVNITYRGCTPAPSQSLTVVKETDPDGGSGFGFTGTNLSPGTFTLGDDGRQVFAGLSPGTFTVEETIIPTGWEFGSVSCVLNGTSTPIGTPSLTDPAVSVTLAAGQHATCTFRNSGLGQIKVVKEANGGGTTTQFGFTATGLTPATFSLVDDGQQLFTGLSAGTYAINEDDIPAYWQFESATCLDDDTGAQVAASEDVQGISLDLQAGQHVTCTFINGQALAGAQIHIEKETAPAGGTGFEFEIGDISGATTFTLDDGQTVSYTGLPAGEIFVGETSLPLGWYFSSVSCVDAAGAPFPIEPSDHPPLYSVTLGEDDNVTCTFHNTKAPKLTIVKATDPVGGTDFGFTSSENAFALDDGDSEVFWLEAGEAFTVTETGLPAGWFFDYVACLDDATGEAAPHGTAAGAVTVTLAAGQDVTCTFHNSTYARLTVVKETKPGGGTAFGFTTTGLTPTSFSLDDGESQVFANLLPGTYGVEEGALPADWHFLSASCTDAAGAPVGTVAGAGVSVALEAGDDVTCTFVNEGDPGEIIVRKVTTPDPAAAQSFGFTSSWGAFSLAGGESAASPALAPGVYSVAEVLPLATGWSPAGAVCSDGSSPSAIGLSPGETVTCVFTNTFQEQGKDEATLVISKAADPADGTEFAFDGPAGAFSLADGESNVITGLEPEVAHVVSEAPTGDWVLEAITCSGGEATVDLETGSVTVTIPAGGTASCLFANFEEETQAPTGSLTIIKQTDPPDGGDFSFDGGVLGTFVLGDGESRLFTELAAGPYTVTETEAGGWLLEEVTCVAGDWSVDDNAVTVNLGEGEAAVCTFHNGEDTEGPGELPYTGGPGFLVPALFAGLGALLIGWSMVAAAFARRRG